MATLIAPRAALAAALLLLSLSRAPASALGYDVNSFARELQATCDPEEEGGEIETEYDGSVAQCAADCRRFHGETAGPSGSGPCPSGDGWAIEFDLGSGRRADVTSCASDEVLTISFAAGTGPTSFTDAERLFLRKIAAEMASRPPSELSDPTSLTSQFHRAAHTLADWPDGLPISYILDPAEQRALQAERNPQFPTGPAVPERRLQVFTTTAISTTSVETEPLYTTMCGQLGSYLESSDGIMSAELGNRPACDGETGMQAYTTEWSCEALPIIPRPAYAAGNCFGRCRADCDGSDVEQITLDCADYDYCTRFGIGSVGGNCYDAFLNAVDDWMFSCNCDESTGACAVPEPTDPNCP